MGPQDIGNDHNPWMNPILNLGSYPHCILQPIGWSQICVCVCSSHLKPWFRLGALKKGTGDGSIIIPTHIPMIHRRYSHDVAGFDHVWTCLNMFEHVWTLLGPQTGRLLGCIYFDASLAQTSTGREVWLCVCRGPCCSIWSIVRFGIPHRCGNEDITNLAMRSKVIGD